MQLATIVGIVDPTDPHLSSRYFCPFVSPDSGVTESSHPCSTKKGGDLTGLNSTKLFFSGACISPTSYLPQDRQCIALPTNPALFTFFCVTSPPHGQMRPILNSLHLNRTIGHSSARVKGILLLPSCPKLLAPQWPQATRDAAIRSPVGCFTACSNWISKSLTDRLGGFCSVVLSPVFLALAHAGPLSDL